MIDDIDNFFIEIFAIIFLGASYNLYIQNTTYGQIAVCIGVILLALSKKKKKNNRIHKSRR